STNNDYAVSSTSIYQGGSFSLGSYAFSSLVVHLQGTETTSSTQTAVSLETGTTWRTGSKNPVSSQSGAAGSSLSYAISSADSLTDANGTFNSSSTVVVA